jgi:hypothetical protein
MQGDSVVAAKGIPIEGCWPPEHFEPFLSGTLWGQGRRGASSPRRLKGLNHGCKVTDRPMKLAVFTGCFERCTLFSSHARQGRVLS